MRIPAAIAAAVLACVACDRRSADEAPQPPAPAPRTVATGAPQIVMAPDGVHLQYRVYGAGDPLVVLVHGWSCDSSYWRHQIAPLSASHTVVTVDLAGHGASTKNRSEWSIANYGEDVAAVVRQIGAPRVVLVGHSMGGPVALEAATRLGERVIGIIGVDTFKRLDQPPPPPATIERRLADFQADFVGTTRNFVTNTFFTSDADPVLVRSIADDMSLAPPEVALPSLASLNAMRFEELLGRITVPIVAINSDLPPDTDEARIRQAVPQFRAVVIENTGHFLMLEDPEAFNRALVREIAALAREPA